jgi:hypothetical protein
MRGRARALSLPPHAGESTRLIPPPACGGEGWGEGEQIARSLITAISQALIRPSGTFSRLREKGNSLHSRMREKGNSLYSRLQEKGNSMHSRLRERANQAQEEIFNRL